jgi:hypothetical protein
VDAGFEGFVDDTRAISGQKKDTGVVFKLAEEDWDDKF